MVAQSIFKLSFGLSGRRKEVNARVPILINQAMSIGHAPSVCRGDESSLIVVFVQV